MSICTESTRGPREPVLQVLVAARVFLGHRVNLQEKYDYPDLAALGVPESVYAGVNLPATQAIGAAVEHLGCDGLIAPSARWPCENLMLFPDRLGGDAALQVARSETIDWLAWAEAKGLNKAD